MLRRRWFLPDPPGRRGQAQDWTEVRQDGLADPLDSPKFGCFIFWEPDQTIWRQIIVYKPSVQMSLPVCLFIREFVFILVLVIFNYSKNCIWK